MSNVVPRIADDKTTLFPKRGTANTVLGTALNIKEPSLDSHHVLDLSYNCIYCGSEMRCLNKCFSIVDDSKGAPPPLKKTTKKNLYTLV